MPLVLAPRNDVAGHKALANFQTGYAASAVIAAQDGIPEKGLMNTSFSNDLPFAGAFRSFQILGKIYGFSGIPKPPFDLFGFKDELVPVLMKSIPNFLVHPAGMGKTRDFSFGQFRIERTEIAKFSGNAGGCPLQDACQFDDAGVVCFGLFEGNSAIQIKGEDQLVSRPG